MKKLRLVLCLILVCVLAMSLIACNKDSVTEKPVYTINFNTNGGSEVAAITIDASTTSITLPENPTKAGFEFEGWYFDNDTFANPANAATILTSLSATAASVTVYAHWVVEITYGDALNSLKSAIVGAYFGLNNSPVAPSAAREAELEALLGFTDGDISSYNYNSETFVKNYYAYCNFTSYVSIINNIGGVDNIPNLSEEDKNFLTDVEKNYKISGTSAADKLDNVNMRLSFTEISACASVTVETFNLYKEHYDLSENIIDYNEYLEGKAELEAMLDLYLATIGSNDIRKDKILAVASFLNSYNYATLIVVNEEGYFDVDPGKAIGFILNVIGNCGLTNEDSGILVYKMVLLNIDLSIDNIDDAVVYTNTELAKLDNTPERIAELNQELADLAAEKADLNVLKGQLNVTVFTDLAAIVTDIAESLNFSNVLSTLFSTMQSEDGAPTLQEMATIFAAMKSTCDNFISSYDTAAWTAAKTSVTALFTSLSQSDLSIAAYFGAVVPFISDFNPCETLGVASRLLALLTYPNLEIFLDVVPNEENEDKRDVKFDITDAYFMQNLAILEAKLIVAITDNTYSQSTFSASYNELVTNVKSMLPMLLVWTQGQKNIGVATAEDESGDEMNTELTLLAAEYAADMLFDLLQDKIVITETRYTAIQTIAAIDFITDANASTSTFTSDMIDDLILTNAFVKINTYTSQLNTIAKKIANDDENRKTTIPAVIMYALDIDSAKLDALSTSLTNAFAGYTEVNYPNGGKRMIIVISCLFDAGFTEAEIVDLITYFGEYAADFALEAYPLSGITNTVFSGFLTNFAADNTDLETIATFAVKAVKIFTTSLASIFAIEGDDFATALPGVIDEIQADLEALKTDYDAAEEAALGSVLTDILAVAKEVILIQIANEDLDLDAPVVEPIFNAVTALFTVYGFDGTIDKIIAVLEEYSVAGAYDFEDDVTGEATCSYQIFLARVAVILFGTDPASDFAAVITAAGTGNDVADLFTDFIGVYSNIQTIAGYSYNTSDAAFITNIDTIKTALSPYFEDEEV